MSQKKQKQPSTSSSPTKARMVTFVYQMQASLGPISSMQYLDGNDAQSQGAPLHCHPVYPGYPDPFGRHPEDILMPCFPMKADLMALQKTAYSVVSGFYRYVLLCGIVAIMQSNAESIITFFGLQKCKAEAVPCGPMGRQRARALCDAFVRACAVAGCLVRDCNVDAAASFSYAVRAKCPSQHYKDYMISRYLLERLAEEHNVSPVIVVCPQITPD